MKFLNKLSNCKLKWLAAILFTAMTISACDEDTQGIGASLTKDIDRFTIQTDTFYVPTRSIIVDSVLSSSSYNYLGRMKDPETGDYVTSSYTTQFTLLEEMAASLFPDDMGDIVSREGSDIVADSCELNIYINSYSGDSLAPMKLMVYEMGTPISEGKLYYSDYDPIEQGLIRTDGIKKARNYTYVNYLLSDSVRSSSSYLPYINIPINEPYTDKNGKTYKNYGTYIMRAYYEHPEYFKNAYSFVHSLCPGFYFRTIDGAGLMAQVYTTELVIYYTQNVDQVPTKKNAVFTGTEEVVQTTNISHDSQRIRELSQDNTCTYLKTPAGLFTEVTLPISEIMRGHESDTLISAKIEFNRYNTTTEYALNSPTTLLMIPKADLYTFFEQKKVHDNKTSFIASLSTLYNTYSFNNISTLITHLYNNKGINSDDWNKVVLVPVECSVSSTTSETTKVSSLMSLTSTRLFGGSANTHQPITISVIYNKGR